MKQEGLAHESFGARNAAKSISIFFVNYVLLFALILLFMLLNALDEENMDFLPFMRELFTSFILSLIHI